MSGMTRPKAKITVTLDADALDRARVVVAEGRARSLSAYLEHAMVAQLTAEAEFDTTVAQMLEATGGPPTKEERAAARSLLSGSSA